MVLFVSNVVVPAAGQEIGNSDSMFSGCCFTCPSHFQFNQISIHKHNRLIIPPFSHSLVVYFVPPKSIRAAAACLCFRFIEHGNQKVIPLDLALAVGLVWDGWRLEMEDALLAGHN